MITTNDKIKQAVFNKSIFVKILTMLIVFTLFALLFTGSIFGNIGIVHADSQLDDARAEKIDTLDNFVINLNQSDYTNDNWYEIQGLLLDAIDEINALDNITDIELFDTDSVIDMINAVGTVAQTTLREVSETRTNF